MVTCKACGLETLNGHGSESECFEALKQHLEEQETNYVNLSALHERAKTERDENKTSLELMETQMLDERKWAEKHKGERDALNLTLVATEGRRDVLCGALEKAKDFASEVMYFEDGSFSADAEAVVKGIEELLGEKQATTCAVCGEHKPTPLRNDEMGGYVCLTCIDKELTKLQDFVGEQL